MAEQHAISPVKGNGTEYTENYGWGERNREVATHARDPTGLSTNAPRTAKTAVRQVRMSDVVPPRRDPTEFHSQRYPSVYRETIIRKDEKGHYIDPYKNIASKPYGRRLIYDDTHPDKMYASKWSSELADVPGPYSFPTTTGLAPEIPWRKDMQWKSEGEVGQWPTDLWKNWTSIAGCPPYDGHDDQVEYSKYKVHVP